MIEYKGVEIGIVTQLVERGEKTPRYEAIAGD